MATAAPDITACTATATLRTGKGVFYGYNVTVVTATGAINIYDNTSATGKVLASLPASTAVGSSFLPANGMRFNTGLFIDYVGGATGTVNVHWK